MQSKSVTSRAARAIRIGSLLLCALGPGCAGEKVAPHPPPPPGAPAQGVPPLAPLPQEAPKPPPAAPAETPAATIEHLLGVIAGSPLVFIRNGSEHTGAEAAAHIRAKYDHYRREIATPEDFIVKAATKSELSGRPYLVRLEDGQELHLADWLTARLAEWRARTPQ